MDQTAPHRRNHSLSAIRDIQAKEDHAHVALDRDFSNAESGGNFFVTFAPRQERQDLSLSRAQFRVWLPRSKRSGDGRRKKAFPGMDPPQSVEEHLARHSLQQISMGPCLE